MEARRIALEKKRAEESSLAHVAEEKARVAQEDERLKLEAVDRAAKLKSDQAEHDQELKEQKELQEADRAKNEMAAAAKALTDGKEVDRLQNELKMK